MALILEFRSGISRPEPASEPTRRGGAQIIIFPGVRRERHVEPERQAEPARQRRRDKARPKRDRLEIPD